MDVTTITVLALDRALRVAGIPIDGVSIGRVDDKATWRVDFMASATAAHRSQAVTVIDGFTVPTEAEIADAIAERWTQRKELRAVAQALYECIPVPTKTPAQLRNRVIEIYKAL